MSNLRYFERIAKFCRKIINMTKLYRAKLFKMKCGSTSAVKNIASDVKTINVYRRSTSRIVRIPSLRVPRTMKYDDVNHIKFAPIFQLLHSKKFNGLQNSDLLCKFMQSNFLKFNQFGNSFHFGINIKKGDQLFQLDGALKKLFCAYQNYGQLRFEKNTSASMKVYPNQIKNEKFLSLPLNIFSAEESLDNKAMFSNAANTYDVNWNTDMFKKLNFLCHAISSQHANAESNVNVTLNFQIGQPLKSRKTEGSGTIKCTINETHSDSKTESNELYQTMMAFNNQSTTAVHSFRRHSTSDDFFSNTNMDTISHFSIVINSNQGKENFDRVIDVAFNSEIDYSALKGDTEDSIEKLDGLRTLFLKKERKINDTFNTYSLPKISDNIEDRMYRDELHSEALDIYLPNSNDISTCSIDFPKTELLNCGTSPPAHATKGRTDNAIPCTSVKSDLDQCHSSDEDHATNSPVSSIKTPVSDGPCTSTINDEIELLSPETKPASKTRKRKRLSEDVRTDDVKRVCHVLEPRFKYTAQASIPPTSAVKIPYKKAKKTVVKDSNEYGSCLDSQTEENHKTPTKGRPQRAAKLKAIMKLKTMKK